MVCAPLAPLAPLARAPSTVEGRDEAPRVAAPRSVAAGGSLRRDEGEAAVEAAVEAAAEAAREARAEGAAEATREAAADGRTEVHALAAVAPPGAPAARCGGVEVARRPPLLPPVRLLAGEGGTEPRGEGGTEPAAPCRAG